MNDPLLDPTGWHNLATTQELVDAYAADDEFARELLERVIPRAIDALYSARDADLVMHGAGAAIAIEVLRVVERRGGLL